MCLEEISSILHTCYTLYIHPGLVARPSMWALLDVLCAYPAGDILGLLAMRLISRYRTQLDATKPYIRILEAQDVVVLSTEDLPRASAVIDAYLANISTGHVHADELKSLGVQVRQWIAGGTLLIPVAVLHAQ